MVTLRQPLTLAECQLVRVWRNAPDVLPMLRTGYKTEAEQAAFYRDVICNPDSEHWYYAVDDVNHFPGDAGWIEERRFIGMAGLTYLDDTPGEAEISLLLGPHARGQGCGSAAVEALLKEAQQRGLDSVYGECYATGNLGFWMAQIRKRPASLEWRWAL